MIPMQQLLDGVASYAINDVIPSMPNGTSKFLAYASVGAMKNNPSLLLKPYECVLKQLGIFSEDGTMLNEKVMKDALDEAFANVPSISLLGFKFDKSDCDKLYRRIGV